MLDSTVEFRDLDNLPKTRKSEIWFYATLILTSIIFLSLIVLKFVFLNSSEINFISFENKEGCKVARANPQLCSCTTQGSISINTSSFISKVTNSFNLTIDGLSLQGSDFESAFIKEPTWDCVLGQCYESGTHGFIGNGFFNCTATHCQNTYSKLKIDVSASGGWRGYPNYSIIVKNGVNIDMTLSQYDFNFSYTTNRSDLIKLIPCDENIDYGAWNDEMCFWLIKLDNLTGVDYSFLNSSGTDFCDYNFIYRLNNVTYRAGLCLANVLNFDGRPLVYRTHNYTHYVDFLEIKAQSQRRLKTTHLTNNFTLADLRKSCDGESCLKTVVYDCTQKTSSDLMTTILSLVGSISIIFVVCKLLLSIFVNSNNCIPNKGFGQENVKTIELK